MENANTARRDRPSPALTLTRCSGWLLFLSLGLALPAYANNPPQPDGLFSMLLVFPVVILAMHFATVTVKPKDAAVRFIGRVAVGILATVFLMAGTELGAVVALAVLVYAIVRGTQIMRRGTSTKRFVIGTAVIVFAMFAFADYYASLVTYYPSAAISEANAVGELRSVSNAEADFVKFGYGPGVGTLKDLETAKLIEDGFSGSRIRKGYLYIEFVDVGKKEYVFCAIPASKRKHVGPDVNVVPGESLIKTIFGIKPPEGTGIRSFSVDQTGILRFSIRDVGRPLAPQEARRWEPLG